MKSSAKSPVEFSIKFYLHNIHLPSCNGFNIFCIHAKFAALSTNIMATLLHTGTEIQFCIYEMYKMHPIFHKIKSLNEALYLHCIIHVLL